MRTWKLDTLFAGYDDSFPKGVEGLGSLIEDTKSFVQSLGPNAPFKETVESYLSLARRLRSDFLKHFAYVNLRIATDAEDEESNKWANRLRSLSAETTTFSTGFSKWLLEVEDFEKELAAEPSLSDYRYHLLRLRENAKYLLGDKEEELVAKLSQTGSNAWGQLQSLLTSTLEVEYEGEKTTLPAIRNKAHSRDAQVRKKAFEAEMEAYKKIEKSVAFALNSIKGEVNELTKKRGFESPLHEAVHNSRMRMETLEALMSAMKERLPMFHKYLRQKAKLLGHEGGLPFYDLFAPLGKSERTFGEDEAMDYVIDNFHSYGERLAKLAKRAKEEEWIDFTPRKGKRGGAFCMNIHPIGESRILTNFTGSFSNVITLAHELGHAYHGEQIFQEDILNSRYTMPLAETASTLCETIVKRRAIRDAKEEEKIFLLEQSLMGSTQVIVDIMSRFLFEKRVFETRKETPLSVEKIKQFMLEAQKEAYGEGLDPDTLHPYMWVNKGHYYSGSLSFYNFPYAFGLLFAKGIYALFEEKGAAFTEEIDTLLQKTGAMDVEDVAALVGIDVEKKDFWQRSLDVIEEEIRTFLELTG